MSLMTATALGLSSCCRVVRAEASQPANQPTTKQTTKHKTKHTSEPTTHEQHANNARTKNEESEKSNDAFLHQDCLAGWLIGWLVDCFKLCRLFVGWFKVGGLVVARTICWLVGCVGWLVGWLVAGWLWLVVVGCGWLWLVGWLVGRRLFVRSFGSFHDNFVGVMGDGAIIVVYLFSSITNN